MKDKANFKVEDDVSALRKAIEGLGKLIIYHYKYYNISITAEEGVFTSSPEVEVLQL